jgi:hypothetical protein
MGTRPPEPPTDAGAPLITTTNRAEKIDTPSRRNIASALRPCDPARGAVSCGRRRERLDLQRRKRVRSADGQRRVERSDHLRRGRPRRSAGNSSTSRSSTATATRRSGPMPRPRAGGSGRTRPRRTAHRPTASRRAVRVQRVTARQRFLTRRDNCCTTARGVLRRPARANVVARATTVASAGLRPRSPIRRAVASQLSARGGRRASEGCRWRSTA